MQEIGEHFAQARLISVDRDEQRSASHAVLERLTCRDPNACPGMRCADRHGGPIDVGS